MMKKILYLIILTLFIAGCSKDEIDVFENGHYIYFNTINNKHEYRYSFLYNDKAEAELRLPISYSGRLLTSDTGYKIDVDKTKSTAVAGEEYALPQTTVFKANVFKDELVLIVKKSARLSNSEQTLSLKLVTNDHFIAGMKDSLCMDIYITNMVSKPEWWTKEIDDAYLGGYSNRKFELFIKNIYAGDYGALTESEKLHYAREFKYWLAKNPEYVDGKLITVPVIG